MSPNTFSAGSGDKLSAVRYGWEHSAQYERMAEAATPPGTLVVPSTDSGNETFALHDAAEDSQVYVAVEDRGRGMDLKGDDYAADDLVKALKPAEETGFNVLLSDGENVTEGEALVSDGTNAGRVRAYDSAGGDTADLIVGYADEDLDLSAAGADDYVAIEIEG